MMIDESSPCIFEHFSGFKEPVVLIGFILMLIDLLIGSIIILIKKLHSTSIINICFMALTYVVLGASGICWCCAMLIVIAYTAYYLGRRREEARSQFTYIIFLGFYELMALLICVQFCSNLFFSYHLNIW
ncbi:unnamed protein product [Schistosoma mattheei]|uniref:Uncharacterized protein n=1 Tax=Schistosoma mattheei TaxID=31246 RepID=A0AA85AQV3_9TREM|nr:unnamed protein product [Schistosoma mattheei]